MDYLLGLDAGTENIGFALTNEGYEVVKANGKNVMGVLSYSEAQKAEARRQFRTARRRLVRRKWRIVLLQEIFEDEIAKQDYNFLRRLNENDLRAEDRKVSGKYSLFNDASFNDKKYYKQYPTIYHLRKDLMQNEPSDIRLLYLAMHHIVKYRGHFLNEGTVNDCKNLLPLMQSLNQLLEERNAQVAQDDQEGTDCTIAPFNLARFDDFMQLISNQGSVTQDLLNEIKARQNNKYKNTFITKKDKKQKAYELLAATSSTQKAMVNAIFGDKVNITNLLGEEQYPKDEVKGFYFSDDFEKVEDLNLLKDNPLDYEIIVLLKQVFDGCSLNDMLNGEDNISSAMVRLYELHKYDLKVLKRLIKKYGESEYEKVFSPVYVNKGELESNYAAYIGGGRYDGKKVGNNGRIGKTCAREDFIKYIKKVIAALSIPDTDPDLQYISMQIEKDMLLPKIVSKDNAAIPYQLNLLELERIIETASKKYPFLKTTDKGWTTADKIWTNAEKIKSLLTFRIPYYVGPVKHYKDDTQRSKNAWAVRVKEGRVTPWSFDTLIDKSLSNAAFINRMTNKCTYLRASDTLPKQSILFSKFVLLSELNKLKVNGNDISIECKQKAYDELYMKERVTIRRLYRYFIDTLKFDKSIKITGYDTELKGNMNSYLMYKRILGDKVYTNPKMVERLIFLSTIHQDSSMIEEAARREFKNILSEAEIKAVKGLRFSGWASLSAELLAGYKYGGIKLIYDGELLDIIDIMYNTNLNLMEITNKSLCNFKEALEEYNERHGITETTDITYTDIDELYCSPSVKRSIWQAFGLVKDIVKQAGVIPDKIFIESTRTNTDDKKGKRSLSRKEMIENAYQEAKKTYKDIIAEVDSANAKLARYTNDNLNSKKLYLYFMQLGKCMYTGTDIDLDLLFNGNYYDIDHIIPRSKVKDDSLDNLVLVRQNENKYKDKEYPLLSTSLRQPELWERLYKAKLISSEKYARLIRKAPITDEEQEKFINRQLVETNQTVKALKGILERYFRGLTDKKIEIVLSKAANVSDFRKEYSLTKSREINDFHHAADAYLNVVVGDLLNKRFNHSWTDGRASYSNVDKSYNFANYLRAVVTRNGKAMLDKIENQLDIASEDYRIIKKIQEGKGELYKATLFAADDKEDSALYARHQSKIVDGVQLQPKSDVSKYGGYKSSGTAYFVIVDSDAGKGKVKRTIEAISIYDDTMLKLGKLSINQVFEKSGLINARLASIGGLKDSKLKVGALLDFGRYKLRLSGCTGNNVLFHNANQLRANNDINRYVKELSVVIEKVNKIAKLEKGKDDKMLDNFMLEIENDKQRRLAVPNQSSDITPITSSKNIELYDFFVEKLSHNPYKYIPSYSSLLAVLQGAKECFINLSLYLQSAVLLNIICAFQCNAKTVDATRLYYSTAKKGGGAEVVYGKKNQCKISKSKDITISQNSKNKDIAEKAIYFISQSKSGIKEKRIKITL